MFLKSLIHIFNSNFFTMTQILIKTEHLFRHSCRMVFLLSAFLWWTTGVRAQVMRADKVPRTCAAVFALVNNLNTIEGFRLETSLKNASQLNMEMSGQFTNFFSKALG